MVSQNLILLISSYIVLIIVLAVIGYFLGKRSDNAFRYARGGALLGVVISALLYFVKGKKLIGSDS